MHPPFAEHVLAHLAAILQRAVDEQSGAKVYTIPTSGNGQEVAGEETKIGEAYKHAKEGLEVVADWLKEPGGFLKRKTFSLSCTRFLFVDFVHSKGTRLGNSRGFTYALTSKERASARRRKRSLIRWIMYD